MTASSLANHFLLKTPEAHDSCFTDTVTYVVQHSDEGALGFVVNQPLPITLSEILSEAKLDPSNGEHVALLEGGPVRPSLPTVIHTKDFKTEGTANVCDDVSFTTQLEGMQIYSALEAIAKGTGPEQFLFVLGYVGWGPGQLEHELENNVWLTCPADSDVLFNDPYEERVDSVSSIIGVDYSRMTPQAGLA